MHVGLPWVEGVGHGPLACLSQVTCIGSKMAKTQTHIFLWDTDIMGGVVHAVPQHQPAIENIPFIYFFDQSVKFLSFFSYYSVLSGEVFLKG